MTKSVILWGSRYIGKTSLLATSFYSAEAQKLSNTFVDIPNSKLSSLASYWHALRQGGPVPATSDKREFELSMHPPGNFTIDVTAQSPSEQSIEGDRLILADMAGGHLDELEDTRVMEKASEAIAQSSGVVFFLPWFRHPRFNEYADLIERTFAHTDLHEKKICVVFTKCEQFLQLEQFNDLDTGWWESSMPSASTNALSDLLTGCGDAVWPTTVFGFLESDTPRALLSEFGKLAPVNPRPLNVTKPFLWMFSELGYGSTS